MKKNTIETWVDNHRQAILLVLILPIGKLLSIIEGITSRITRPRPAHHALRVERVRQDVARYAEERQAGRPEGLKPLRTDRKSAQSLNVRVSDKSGNVRVRMQDLRTIVSVDTQRMIVRVEPFVTIGDVGKHLDRKGLQLASSIEMKGATMAGLVLAVGMTTNSHIVGLMSDIVEAYQVVTAAGEILRVEREGEHADLFRAMPWSHGTLGLLTALELRIEKAPKYVRLVYRPIHSMDEFCVEHTRLLTAENPPDYLEAQVFGKDAAVIIEGYREFNRPESRIQVNNVAAWHKPYFFKHVESMLNLPEGEQIEELVPNTSFLMRHDRSMCMTMGKILPEANHPVYRHLFGWMLPPNMPLLKNSRPPEERERTMKRQVYQDIGFPAEHLKEILLHIDDEFEIYPLLVYPCRVFDRGGMVRLPGSHGTEWNGEVGSALYLNLGIYGEPKAIRNGNLTYPTITRVRHLEAMIASFGGFLHTYVDVFSTREEFEAMFDHSLWKRMRERYGAEGVFPTVYDKIRPEIDPMNQRNKPAGE